MKLYACVCYHTQICLPLMRNIIAHAIHSSHYISAKNVQSASGTSQKAEPTIYDRAFHILAKEMQEELSRTSESVTTLSSKCSRFIRILIDLWVPEDEASGYTSWKLKRRIQGHFQKKISFIERPGLPDLICSSKLTVGDVLDKAEKLKAELLQQDADMEAGYVEDSRYMDEALILHRAAGILRKAMSGIKDSKDS